MKRENKPDTRERWNIVHLRTALRGVVVSCLTVRTPAMDDGRWSSVGGPSSWSVVGITRRSVVLAPISIHGEAMLDRTRSFTLPAGESVSAGSPPMSKTMILPAQAACFNRLLAALPAPRARRAEVTDGYRDLLSCPSCGELCQTMMPNRPTPQHRYPWWEGGQYATCQCGADLLVDADGERAWLVERNAKPNAEATPPACAPPAHPAFDCDIYDCPCGHMYGDHEYHYVDREMVIDGCVSCSSVRPRNRQ